MSGLWQGRVLQAFVLCLEIGLRGYTVTPPRRESPSLSPVHYYGSSGFLVKYKKAFNLETKTAILPEDHSPEGSRERTTILSRFPNVAAEPD